MKKIAAVSGNLKKYLIFYSLAVLGGGWILGVEFHHLAFSNRSTFSTLITIIVFMMIYPMMVNLDLGEIPRIFKDPKPVLLSLVYNYALSPAIAFLFAFLFIHNAMLSLGFMLVMLIPCGSSSVGYTGLSGGSVETATVAQAINFILIPVLMPLYLTFVMRSSNVPIPMNAIMKSILIVIVLPMILGYLTRFSIIKVKGKVALKKIQPLLALITLLSLLAIVGMIFFMKGDVLLKKWDVLVTLSLLTLAYLILILPLITFLDKKFHLSYKDHMGIVYLSSSKNNGTAIAIATMAFNPLVAIPAAVIPLFQLMILIAYIHLEKPIKRYFGSQKTKKTTVVKPEK